MQENRLCALSIRSKFIKKIPICGVAKLVNAIVISKELIMSLVCNDLINIAVFGTLIEVRT